MADPPEEHAADPSISAHDEEFNSPVEEVVDGAPAVTSHSLTTGEFEEVVEVDTDDNESIVEEEILGDADEGELEGSAYYEEEVVDDDVEEESIEEEEVELDDEDIDEIMSEAQGIMQDGEVLHESPISGVKAAISALEKSPTKETPVPTVEDAPVPDLAAEPVAIDVNAEVPAVETPTPGHEMGTPEIASPALETPEVEQSTHSRASVHSTGIASVREPSVHSIASVHSPDPPTVETVGDDANEEDASTVGAPDKSESGSVGIAPAIGGATIGATGAGLMAAAEPEVEPEISAATGRPSYQAVDAMSEADQFSESIHGADVSESQVRGEEGIDVVPVPVPVTPGKPAAYDMDLADDDDEASDDEMDEIDVETGEKVPAEAARSAKGVVGDEDGARWKRPRVLILICLAVALMSAIAIAVPITLLDDDNTTRSGPIPEGLPTDMPTAAPTPKSLFTFDQIATFIGDPNSNYGESVAISESGQGSFMAVGAPNTGPQSTGAVVLHQEFLSGWAVDQELEGPQTDGMFGMSVAMTAGASSPVLVVGAPGVFFPLTSTPTGAAYVYSYNGDWQELGGPLSGSNNAGEMFGSAVAVSDLSRVVVGAPMNGDNGEGAGRVYTYQLLNGNWTMDESIGLTGDAAGAGFGSALAISPNGNILVVGAPGSNRASIYSYGSVGWQFLGADEFRDSNIMFGASVAFLSENYVAVGAPNDEGGAGSVRVYARDASGNFQRLPETLAGTPGDSIGAKGTISGSEMNGQPVVVVGTSSGLVKRYDYEDGMWVENYEVEDTGFAREVSSLATSIDGLETTVIAGSAPINAVVVLEANTDIPTRAPTPATTTDAPTVTPGSPTRAPTAAPTLNLQDWILNRELLQGTGSLYGSSAAIGGNIMAVGAPEFNLGTGVVQTLALDGTDWVEFSGGSVFFPTGGSFGYDLDVVSGGGTTRLFVGSPVEDDTQGFGVEFGAVHAYTLSGDGSTWNTLGEIISPGVEPPKAQGRFGHAVAAATSTTRVAVGAPATNLPATDGGDAALLTGAVYVYEYNAVANTWDSVGAPIAGPGSPGSFLGASVAISQDGNRVLVGAPGFDSGLGIVLMYEWNGSDWRTIFALGDTHPREATGSSVAILSADGNTIAFGGPGYDGGRGRIRVYQRGSADPVFRPVGDDLIGEPGDQLGSEKTMTGSATSILVGTVNGTVKRYDLNNGRWMQATAAQPVGGSVSSVAAAPDMETFVAGISGQDKAVIYDLAALE